MAPELKPSQTFEIILLNLIHKSKKAKSEMMRPATIFLGQRRRGEGLARAEEGSGEESARASAFFFEKIGGYDFIK
ncbi:MAG: hypothetical protein A3B14_01365 [Candidatus Zambryskibacteria bacterium RIFCSPLOWO2_01_FULL_45_21]|uniref:Uncharacterized protein n=1 Tax=Candidatus Zambryskibacteria bacterium RIFCSPLOWO2_01_FULL_45_21 TaxID=1802761 RepID=A0A1G2U3S5_9BACT|nr:MAG: hypothetical protein A3B14_01365 [Candidatus Zambryskibacteria bacterium RIFCSPLOWO2_01_FULL_45_21]